MDLGKSYTLITGASSGIGYALSHEAAKHQCHLILVARREGLLKKLKHELLEVYDIDVVLIPIDCAVPGAAKQLYDDVQAKQLHVNCLINNAGFGWMGDFQAGKRSTYKDMLTLNVVFLTELTHLFSEQLALFAKGHIMQIASIAAFMPGAGFAVYYASKAYVLSLGRALAKELRPKGIMVTTVCPGITRTGFFERAEASIDKAGFLSMSADKVAAIAYRAMVQGKVLCIPGWHNRFSRWVMMFLPERLLASLLFYVNQRLRKPSA